MVSSIWRRYSPLIHVTIFVLSMGFTAGIVWAGVAGYDGRIAILEHWKARSELRQIRVDGNVELLMRALNVKPLPPVDSGD